MTIAAARKAVLKAALPMAVAVLLVAPATALGAQTSRRCHGTSSTVAPRSLIVYRISCAAARTLALAYVNSVEYQEAVSNRFTYGGRRWLCSARGYWFFCRSGRSRLRFYTRSSPMQTCAAVYVVDGIDGVSFDLSPMSTGGVTCSFVNGFVAALYARGLDARNGHRGQYAVDGVNWTCITDSEAMSGAYSGADDFSCTGQPDRGSSLTQRIEFGATPPVIEVQCAAGSCEETAPGSNPAYAPAPQPGSYNQRALCTWRDAGPTSDGSAELYQCAYPAG